MCVIRGHYCYKPRLSKTPRGLGLGFSPHRGLGQGEEEGEAMCILGLLVYLSSCPQASGRCIKAKPGTEMFLSS